MAMQPRGGKGTSARGRGKHRNTTGWEQWGGYMQAKIQKLEQQFEKEKPSELLQGGGQLSDIFKRVGVFVNGYTRPTSSEIRCLMMQHGGTFHDYYRRERVTHIIASNLPDSKIMKLTDQKVVRPEWIVDSVEAGRLLPYEGYLLYTSKGQVQPGLIFKTVTRKKSPESNKTLPVLQSTSSLHVSGIDLFAGLSDEEMDVDPSCVPRPVAVVDTLRETVKIASESNAACVALGTSGETLKNASVSSVVCDAPGTSGVTVKNAGLSSVACEAPDTSGETVKNTGKSSVPCTSRENVKINLAHKTSIDMQNPTEKVLASNFVSEFYQNSRLHYLSTWGAEFRAYVNELQIQGNKTFLARNMLQRERHSVAPAKVMGTPAKVIMHIDMDSFFVSVGLRKRPKLKGKPVAVTHSRGRGVAGNRPGADPAYEQTLWEKKRCQCSRGGVQQYDHPPMHPEDEDSPDEDTIHHDKTETFTSMSEIASCSYEARSAGVQNGMFVGTAKLLCPDLVTIPYDFDSYRHVSQQLYDTVASFTHDIEAVSCDEMLVDLSSIMSDTGATPEEIASLLREQIHDKTGCTASVGMGSNILIARMATRVAKPNGQCYVEHDKVSEFIQDKPVSQLPGVGRVLKRKFQSLEIATCRQLQRVSLETLKKEFGPKTGESLYSYCRGLDSRRIRLERERKSVSAEINYGIRFTKESEVERFIGELAAEVQTRMEKIKAKGRAITLKLKVRSEDAPRETAKFLGHGVCDNVSKSVMLPLATDVSQVIAKECMGLLCPLKISPPDYRGIGIQVSKLEFPIGKGSMKSGVQSILNFATSNVSILPPDQNPPSPAQQTDGLRDVYHAEPVLSSSSTPVCTSQQNTSVLKQSDGLASSESAQIHFSQLPPLPMLPDFLSPEPKQIQHNTSSVKTTPHHPVQLTAEELLLPSPSQVDPDVLKELPPDIRHEMEAAMKSRHSRVGRHECEAAPCRQRLQTGNHQSRSLHHTGESISTCTGNGMKNDAEQPGCSHWDSHDASQDPKVNSKNELISAKPPFSYSQIDPAYLEALPSELQKELQETYGMKDAGRAKVPEVHPLLLAARNSPQKISPKKSPVKSRASSKRGRGRRIKSPSKSFGRGRRIESPSKSHHFGRIITIEHGTTPDVLLPNDGTQTFPETETVKLCNAFALEDVKQLITEWIMSTTEPEVQDEEQFLKYLYDLVQDKNLEMVHLLLRFLPRCLKRYQKSSSKWEIECQKIINDVQNLVQAVYGGGLKL